MRRTASILLSVSAAALAFAATIAMAQTPSPRDFPNVGDLMNTVIQPRHAKLGLAGAQQNWPLAGYLVNELQQSFANVGKIHPMWRRLSLPDMFESTVGEPLKALGAAVKSRNAADFAAAYAKLTAACNACHTAANHPFIVIKVPNQSAFPNQDFHAKP